MALPSETIITRRLRLEPLVPDDADEMVSVLNDARLHEFTGGDPLSLDQLRRRYEQFAIGHSGDGTQQWLNWILRTASQAEAIGFVQATVSDAGHRAEVAWVVAVGQQGHGFASEAAAAVVDWLLDEGVSIVQAHIHPEHHASARVASRAGLAPSSDIVEGEVVWRRSSGS